MVGLKCSAGRSFDIEPGKSSIFIIPAAHGWNFVCSAEQNGSWNVRKLQTLEEAVPLLSATDEFVLGLPVSAVLAQRFRLPSVDPAEFPEMVRIQIEKLLPFTADEVTTDFELIQQSESESVVSAVAIRNEQLAKAQLNRARILFDDGAIPKSAMEVAQTNEDNALVDVESTTEHLKILGADPDHPSGVVEVYAPVSGVITDQQITANTLRYDDGKDVLRLWDAVSGREVAHVEDLNPVRCLAFASERDLVIVEEHRCLLWDAD